MGVMITPQINSEKIFNAITSQRLPAAATELGAELVDAWVEQCVAHDQAYRTLLLEAGFYIPLGPKTWVVGACDRVMLDEEGVLLEEMKTTSAGSKTWTPERWYDQLAGGHQVATYAAALQRGSFIIAQERLPNWAVVDCDGPAPPSERDITRFAIGYEKGGLVWTPNVTSPRILLRAVSKSKPPQIWPTPAGAFVTVLDRRIDAALNAYRNEAAAIRARRATQLVPWQLVGQQCIKKFGFKEFPCQFLRACQTGEVALTECAAPGAGLSPGSNAVVQFLIKSGRIALDEYRDHVILSASSFENLQQCPELWRRLSEG